MIVTHSTDAVNTTGTESADFGVNIDPVLYKLLFSSMYEDKEQVVLQELAANALDAHIEAGKEDTPISITLPTEMSPELVIADTGHGMTKEFATTLYTTYGSSSKRDSNDGIGGFGYGSKSPFAISEAFSVETTHEGYTTHISCYLDAGQPKFSVFKEGYLNNPSGTTIRVPVSDEDSIEKLLSKVKYLFILWDTQPNISNGSLTEDENPFIANEDDYCIITQDAIRRRPGTAYFTSVPNYVAVGPYLYSMPKELIDKLGDETKLQNLFNMKFPEEHYSVPILKFPVGDIELSPSREVIENITENRNKIFQKYIQLAEETQAKAPEEIFPHYVELCKHIEENNIKFYNSNKIGYITSDPLPRFFNNILEGSTCKLVEGVINAQVRTVDGIFTGLEKASDEDIDIAVRVSNTLNSRYTEFARPHSKNTTDNTISKFTHLFVYDIGFDPFTNYREENFLSDLIKSTGIFKSTVTYNGYSNRASSSYHRYNVLSESTPVDSVMNIFVTSNLDKDKRNLYSALRYLVEDLSGTATLPVITEITDLNDPRIQYIKDTFKKFDYSYKLIEKPEWEEMATSYRKANAKCSAKKRARTGIKSTNNTNPLVFKAYQNAGIDWDEIYKNDLEDLEQIKGETFFVIRSNMKPETYWTDYNGNLELTYTLNRDLLSTVGKFTVLAVDPTKADTQYVRKLLDTLSVDNKVVETGSLNSLRDSIKEFINTDPTSKKTMNTLHKMRASFEDLFERQSDIIPVLIDHLPEAFIDIDKAHFIDSVKLKNSASVPLSFSDFLQKASNQVYTAIVALRGISRYSHIDAERIIGSLNKKERKELVDIFKGIDHTLYPLL